MLVHVELNPYITTHMQGFRQHRANRILRIDDVLASLLRQKKHRRSSVCE